MKIRKYFKTQKPGSKLFLVFTGKEKSKHPRRYSHDHNNHRPQDNIHHEVHEVVCGVGEAGEPGQPSDGPAEMKNNNLSEFFIYANLIVLILHKGNCFFHFCKIFA